MNRSLINRLGCALLLAGCAAASAQDRVIGPLPSLAPLVEQVAPAVVNIAVRGTAPVSNGLIDEEIFERFFGEQAPEPRQRNGEGSGVIVDAEQGYLLTNHHVIENADEILVTLADRRQFTAEIVGSDADSDLAVLKIEATGLTDIPFTPNDDLRVGDYVVAIGNPLGFENTVTAGIVSGLGRSGLNRDPTVFAYEDFIQTDASINVGNSGGALVDLSGALVGINSAIISQTGGNIGIGLAIPSDMAVAVMDQLVEFGEVRRGFLGITMLTVTQNIADDYALSVTSGALVTEISPGSAAEAAGIQTDDVLIAVNGEQIETGNDLRNTIGLMRPGEAVEIEIVRDGRSMSLTAVLGMRPAAQTAGPSPVPDEPIFDGVVLTEVQRGQVAGLAVASVEPESLAANQGLREGDVITSINRRRVTSLAEAQAIVDGADIVIVAIRRGNRDIRIQLR